MEGQNAFVTSDSYVKLKVYQDNWTVDKTIGEDETRVIKSLNPEWDETFEFLLPSNNPTTNMVLKLKVMDKDIASNDKMGKCEIKLDDLNLSTTPIQVVKTVDTRLLHTNPKIYVSLSLA